MLFDFAVYGGQSCLHTDQLQASNPRQLYHDHNTTEERHHEDKRSFLWCSIEIQSLSHIVRSDSISLINLEQKISVAKSFTCSVNILQIMIFLLFFSKIMEFFEKYAYLVS